MWCECVVFKGRDYQGQGITEANKPCPADNDRTSAWYSDEDPACEQMNWCTCTNGRPAPAQADDAALVCATDGAEDCRVCDAGFAINAPVRASQRGSLRSAPPCDPPHLPSLDYVMPCHAMPCHTMPTANTLHPRTTVGADRLAPACKRAAVRRYHDSIPTPSI